MAKSPSISVIIPFFNAEAYLDKCLQSLSDQDITEPFEVLMINDCSRDNSLKKIENFNTLNIKVFSLKKNSGPSVARNKGIKEAIGEYVFFLDADDYISKDALNTLFTKAKAKNLDLIFCDKKRVEGSINKRENIYSYSSSINFTKTDIIEEIKRRVTDPNHLLGVIGCHGKLIKYSILLEKNIKFEEKLRFMEDEIFMIDILGCSNKVSYVRKQLYINNINHNVSSARSEAFNHTFPSSNFKIMSSHYKESLIRKNCNKEEVNNYKKQALIFYIIYALISYSLSIFKKKVSMKKGLEQRNKIFKEVLEDIEITEAAKSYLPSKDESSWIPRAISYKSHFFLKFFCNLRTKQLIKKN
jgi:glycosyltransferase involved in cell wall biosynthesis